MLPAGDLEGDLLIVAWGSTSGSITAALKAQRAKGRKSAICTCGISIRCLESRRHFQTLQENSRPELNMGQLLWVLRAKYSWTPLA